MGSFATGVCVVTGRDGDGRAIGLTVNSFSSVSLDPPLVLVCLGADSPRAQTLIDSGRFNISMLAAGQVEVSNHFAQPGEGLAADDMVVDGQNGAPLINGAAAQVECDLETQYQGGDHTILVGRVSHVESDSARAPLLFFRGHYGALGPEV